MYSKVTNLSEAPIGTKLTVTDPINGDILRYELTKNGYKLVETEANLTKKWASTLKGGSEINDTSMSLFPNDDEKRHGAK